MKKFITTIMACMLLALMALPVMAQEETRTADSYLMYDIWGHWAEDELDDLVNADIIKGYQDADGDYYLNPGGKITRAQFAAITVRALGLEATGEGKVFSDISAHGLKNEIQIASDHGIARGREDGTYNPNAPITRDQLATMIVRAFNDTIEFTGTAKEFTDVSSDYWAALEITEASRVGVIRGDEKNHFRPREQASRAHAAVMIHRALQLEQSNTPSDADLTSFVLNSETESFPLFASSDTNGLLAHNAKYYTGYQKASADEMVEWFFEDSTTQEMAFTNEPTLTVLSKSNRYAKVELDGELSLSYTDSSTNFSTVMPYTSTYYVKNVDGEWKVYYTDIPFELDDLE
ncbi:S-layer homology domain-containing protein [Bacillus solitudinis]|uniref:S-layer homology domain-containing protein n=1 Tax=Bacillus solitudinis TaxID=2014074 RepID=UPI000C2327CE|nr:S-layer homology domain-containing protein [Bacillus solitudinis]